MNVLSLFDGCSGAMQALKNQRIDVEYFSSEIDKYAIKISKKNHPNINYLGDIETINISKLPQKIDLLIAGFPCQDLSRNNKNRKGLKGKQSGLFFHALKIMDKVKPDYFIFENVSSSYESRGIDKYLGISPIKINSCDFSPQLRSRFYWANFPVKKPKEINNLCIRDILINRDFSLPYNSRVSNPGIVRWIGRTHHKSLQRRRVYSLDYKSPCINASFSHFIGEKGMCRALMPEELEQLQGLPIEYTAGVSNSQRLKMIGNGFTIPVIEHLLKYMNKKIYRQINLFTNK